MFKNDVNERYHILDRYENQWYLCRDREDLLSFISKNAICYKWKSCSEKIPYFNYTEFDFSGNDTCYLSRQVMKPVRVRDYEAEQKVTLKKKSDRWNNAYEESKEPEDTEEIRIYKWVNKYVTVYEKTLRRYLVLNDAYAIVDIRKFEKEVIAFREKKEIPSWQRKCDNAEHGDFVDLPSYYKGGNVRFRFREDPVPRVHNNNSYHCPSNGHRAQLVTREGVRPKCRINPIDLCDGRYRHTDRNWKSSHKCRHQWEKHMVRRGKGHNVYVMKDYPLYEEEEDILQKLMEETYLDMCEEAA